MAVRRDDTVAANGDVMMTDVACLVTRAADVDGIATARLWRVLEGVALDEHVGNRSRFKPVPQQIPDQDAVDAVEEIVSYAYLPIV